MKKSLITLMGLSALCVSSAVFAAHSDNGVYVDLGAGYGKVNIDNAGKNKGFTGTANLGYQFTPHLALEVGATSYHKVLGERNYNTHVAAKAILPVGDKVDVFGKAGVAYVHAIDAGSYFVASKKAVAPYVGVGASYWISDNVAATVQAEATAKRHERTPAMFATTAGLTWKF